MDVSGADDSDAPGEAGAVEDGVYVALVLPTSLSSDASALCAVVMSPDVMAFSRLLKSL